MAQWSGQQGLFHFWSKRGDSRVESGFSDPICSSSFGPCVPEAFLVPGVQGQVGAQEDRREGNSWSFSGHCLLRATAPPWPALPLGPHCCRLAQEAPVPVDRMGLTA